MESCTLEVSQVFYQNIYSDTVLLIPSSCDSAGFVLASHLGVLADIPCVGVGKKLYHVDGLTKGPEHKDKV